MAGKRTIRPTAGADERLLGDQANSPEPIAGVAGPGRWLVFDYAPVALFSLKASFATSSVGRSLVVPTPYAIKMAFVDAAFRAGRQEETCASLVRALAGVDVRIAPPARALVTHTFLKVRQEPKKSSPGQPYISAVAYRDFVAHYGHWHWAFNLAACDLETAELLVTLAPCIRYIGKRGSFVQYVAVARRTALDERFTWSVGDITPTTTACHVVQLDDFGPEADLDALNSFTKGKMKRDKHRKFVPTVIPLGVVATGPGFTEYRAAGEGADNEQSSWSR